MKSLLLTLSIVLFTALMPIYSHGAGCQGKVVNTTLGSLSWNAPTIDINGSLRIFTGNNPAEVVDIFTSNHEAFTGFTTSVERVDDKDQRNWFMRKVFPKDLRPSEYYLIFSLTDSGQDAVKDKKTTKLTLSLRVGNQTKSASLEVSPNPSWNCK